MRYFSTSIRFVFFYICNIRELLKRAISPPQFSLYSHLFADSDIVFNALFLSLNSLCILIQLQHKRASYTHYFSAKVLFVFLSFCRFRYRFECVFSKLHFALYSFFICNVRKHLKRVISLYLQLKKASKTRYFSAKILFVFPSILRFRYRFKCVIFQPQFALYSFLICNIRELLKRVISLPKFSFFSYLFADSNMVLNALFVCLNSLCILFNLQDKRASKTGYFWAKFKFI